jgi:spermidine synthase
MIKKNVSGGSTGRIMLLVLICFFLSGLTGLVYQILWVKMIVKIIGCSPFAVTIVLTVFMGGLGIGSFIAGRTVDRVAESASLIRIYGILELAIGGYGLVLPILLKAFKPLYAIVYNQLFSHFMLYNFITFIGCSIILCIPVICMGATLPILCRFYVTKLSRLGTDAGRLYGLNTTGAALGALLCGFWLINLLGVQGTLFFAVVINCLIGLTCFLAGLRLKASLAGQEKSASDVKESTKESTDEKRELSAYPAVVKAALLIFAVSGFCTMAYEVIWTKLLGLIVGPTTYSFTIVLVTFIMGLALGSMIFGYLGDKTRKPVWLLLGTQVAAALLVLAISQIMGNSQTFFTKLIFTFKDQFVLCSLVKAIVLFIFMILPTLCLGATFPLVGKIYTQSLKKIAKSIGFAYAINIIGAVLGSFCAGFLLIPLLGKENSLSLVVGIQLLASLAVAGLVFYEKKAKLWKLTALALPAMAGLVFCFYLPMWNRLILSKGKYHRFEKIQADIKNVSWVETLLNGPELLARAEQGELVYYGDGIGGFTTVLKYADAIGNIKYAMTNSGKVDASSRDDMATQILLAHFPMLFHKDTKTIMVLGLASGVTAGEVLYYPIERLDVIDISQQVVEASKIFIPYNNNVLADPRTNLIIQDARAHLLLTKQKYDVIISEPSNPWMAGLAALFTRDFFELAKNKLNEGGIFVQFIHSYQMNWDIFSMVGRTFAEVFPNSLLLRTAPSRRLCDYLLVGFKTKTTLSMENVKRRLAYAQKSQNVKIPNPKVPYRLVVSEDLLKLFGPGPVNTDEQPSLEFAAPKLMYYSDESAIEKNIEDKKWLSEQTRNIVEELRTDVDLQIDFAVYALSLYDPFPDMIDFSNATTSQKARFFKLMDNYIAENEVDFNIFKNDQLRQRCIQGLIIALENKIDALPNKALSHWLLADLYVEMDMADKAIYNYSKSLRIKQNNPAVLSNLGELLARKGHFNEALIYYKKALEFNPYYAKVHYNLGMVQFQLARVDDAIKSWTETIRLDPNNIDAYSNLAVAFYRKGRFEEALSLWKQALRIQPDDDNAKKNLQQALAELGRSN